MRKFLISAMFIIFIIILVSRVFTYLTLVNSSELKLFLVYNSSLLKDYEYILRAYESVLQEEGIPFQRIDYSLLNYISINENFTRRCPVIILPDGAMQYFNPDFKNWFEEYLDQGGNLLLIYDVGVKDYKGRYLKKALFADILGINYATYDKLKEKAYTQGYVKVNNAKLLGITPGKLDQRSRLFKGYVYGPLEYPVAQTEVLNSSFLVLGEIVREDGERLPGIILKAYKKGKILYVNLPLGYLKAYSDDLLIRSVIRTFFFKILNIPHLLNTPYGVGGLVINWHIDSNIDWKSILYMLEKGYFVKYLKFSTHITAGDFRDMPGDKLGFDACNKGRKYVKMIMPYSEIGSHGGWAHNWFSEGILKRKFSKREIEEYINKNNRCLESITKYKIREYSAPNGVHPQPETTEILEKLDMVAYYYTGDSGSSPNRTFFKGKMVSSKVIAFPITSYEQNASLFEMWKAGIKEEKVETFLLELLQYIVREKTVRLFYSHPYDIFHYPKAIKNFIEYASILQKKDLIKVESMSYFADFLLRFLDTKYSFEIKSDFLEIRLENNKGLKGITLAIPKKYKLISEMSLLRKTLSGYYKYITITEDVKKVILTFKE